VGHSPIFRPLRSAPSWMEKALTYFRKPSAADVHRLASVILEPGFNQPGQCLPLAASSDVYVIVALRTPIFPDQVVLTHVSKVKQILTAGVRFVPADCRSFHLNLLTSSLLVCVSGHSLRYLECT
jgi:hypothetical protein